jgi:hypothetical protein
MKNFFRQNSLFWCIKQKWQKLTRGYSDEELWNLDETICEWILPRLKAFKEKTFGYPPDLNSPKEWDELLDKMILAFELHISDVPNSPEQARKEGEQIEEGMKLFCKYFRNLWW